MDPAYQQEIDEVVNHVVTSLQTTVNSRIPIPTTSKVTIAKLEHALLAIGLKAQVIDGMWTIGESAIIPNPDAYPIKLPNLTAEYLARNLTGRAKRLAELIGIIGSARSDIRSESQGTPDDDNMRMEIIVPLKDVVMLNTYAHMSTTPQDWAYLGELNKLYKGRWDAFEVYSSYHNSGRIQKRHIGIIGTVVGLAILYKYEDKMERVGYSEENVKLMRCKNCECSHECIQAPFDVRAEYIWNGEVEEGVQDEINE